MQATSGVDLCRVTVVAPRTRMDLALPIEAPLADLLPTLLRYAGENPDDPAFLRGGWILQRLGEDALDASQRLGNLGVRDGDVLYLRHREEGIPEFAFDDVADAITTSNRTKRAAWQPKDTRQASLLVAGAFVILGALVALTTGPGWIVNGILLLVTAVGFVIGGLTLSRAAGEADVGAFLGLAGVVYAGLGGALLLAGDAPPFGFGATQMVVGFACAFAFAGVAAFAIVAAWNAFFGAAVTALVGVAASVTVLVFDITATQAAAVAVTVMLGLTPMLPTMCARLSRLPIPQLPLNAEELRKQTDILPGPSVLQQALTADRMMVGLLGTTGVVCAGGAVYLIAAPGWYGTALTAAAGLALLTRARHFRGRAQRIWMIAGGIFCAAMLVVGLSRSDDGQMALLVVGVPCLLAAGAMAAWAVAMPERRLVPTWGRLADILEVLVLLTLIPLTAAILGLYSSIFSLFG